MMSVQIPVYGNPRHNGYGIGYQISSDGASSIVGHSGDFVGYISGLYFEPETKLGVILLRNFSEDRTSIRKRVIELLRKLVSVY